MVAISDFGIREREQMVMLAIRYGWIFEANKHGLDHGVADPVVLLVAGDALDAFPLKFVRQPDPGIERLQRKAGCKRFIVAVASYAKLLRCNAAEGWHDDMEEMRRKGGTSVVCITRTGQFLAAVQPAHRGDG